MPLHIVQNDITQMNVDAIVNAADPLLPGDCPTGSARLTAAYGLPCKYMIHTVTPRWQDGCHDERALLASCYLAALVLADEHGCESVAFPLLSSDSPGYPREQALDIAIDTIGHFVLQSDMTVYLVVFDRAAYQLKERYARISGPTSTTAMWTYMPSVRPSPSRRNGCTARECRTAPPRPPRTRWRPCRWRTP